MMNYWNETPLFRFLLVFISGILPAIYLPCIGIKGALATCICLIVVFFALFTIRKKIYTYSSRWIAGMVAYLAVFAAGYLLTILNDEKNYPEHFRHTPSAAAYIGYLTEPVSEKTKSYKTVLKIQYLENNGHVQIATGYCIVYMAKDAFSASLKYGDRILFSEKPVEVLPPQNPSQFDYKKWLGYNKIFDQVYIPAGKTSLIDHHQGFRIAAYAFELRGKLMKIFSDNHVSGQDYAVLSALILGYDGDIDQEIISAYAASGALHVLSVSGLHVGIIYVAINFFLGFLNHSRRSRLFKSAMIISFLWFYALLTGLSPSVLRSAMMLTFIVVGKMTRQHTNLYNTLAASAFFLLAYNPFLLMQVGFQLSYIAVLGIILLQPTIQSCFDPSGWFLRQVWSLVSVSIAAQLATFPLGLLYFHQFPVYFLFSNMVVIPLSTVIIYGGILLLIISGWTYGAALVGMVTGNVVHWMNAIVVFTEHLPYSLIMGISITILETIVLYVLIGSLISFITYRKEVFLVSTFVFVFILLGSQILEAVAVKNQKQMVVYSMKGKSVINLISGEENIIKADTGILHDKFQMQFNIYQYWWDCGLKENNAIPISADGSVCNSCYCYKGFIRYGKLDIACVSDTGMVAENMGKIQVDFLVISGNLRKKLCNILKHISCRQLIIDSSNSGYRAAKWLDEAKQLGVEAYSVPHQGAFVYDLSRD